MDFVRLWFRPSRCHGKELLPANAGAVFETVFSPGRKQIRGHDPHYLVHQHQVKRHGRSSWRHTRPAETRDTVRNKDKVTGQPVPQVKDRGLIMRRERIEYLERAGFRAPDISIPQTEDVSRQKNQKDGTHGGPGFGGCAEVAMK